MRTTDGRTHESTGQDGIHQQRRAMCIVPAGHILEEVVLVEYGAPAVFYLEELAQETPHDTVIGHDCRPFRRLHRGEQRLDDLAAPPVVEILVEV